MKVATKNIEVFVNATLSLATGLGLDTEETLGAIFIIQRRLSKRENVPLLHFLQRIFDATLHVVMPSGKDPILHEDGSATFPHDGKKRIKCDPCPQKANKGPCTTPDCTPYTHQQPSPKPEATKAKGKRRGRK